MNAAARKLIQGLVFAQVASLSLWSEGPIYIGHNSQMVAAGGTIIFEFPNFYGIGPTRDVRWSVVQSDGGVITANGVYKAPAKLGKYRVEGFSLIDPRTVAFWEVEVINPSKIKQAWEIEGNINTRGAFFNMPWHHLQYLDVRDEVERRNKHDQEGEIEFGFKSGKVLRLPCFFWAQGQPWGVETRWNCIAENQDLAEVNNLRLILKDGTSRVLLEEAVDGELSDQEWSMVEISDGKFKFHPTQDWSGDYRKRIKIYVSWDRGLTWQAPALSSAGTNWMQCLIPLGGLLEDPDPLVQFEITKGFNRKAKTYSLKDILKRSNQITPKGVK